ncbi:putative membrane protein YmcC [Paenibacillus baekrokdamisoli]|uniref:Putative membrane protein YmcC n=1 Tax=Paenibacillus baekrokdamisoli TaxID=1712516 RepID=A0A3G9IMG3_9BACL|nr:hypothetical protein [Paenibacillus baekrokdamisoli]MBB3070681.1 hypothetical protein [Paenibacillus baekrokdamisoli]BBH20030.1 putative membrane protein YmcC [Paenibacillus baekrokdamisoli]
MIAWFILACEIGFWVFVIAGLFMRYVLKQKKFGGFLLLCTPLIDLILIIVTIIDLRNGTKADFFHGLAAIYIGVTIAYGHRMIQWADARFAHWFAGRAKPQSAPKFGKQHASKERADWFRHLLAWAIGVALLFGMVFIIGNLEQTSQLLSLAGGWTVVLLIDFLISFSYTLWPKKGKDQSW